MKGKKYTSSWYRDIKKLGVSIGVVTPYFDCLMKWNPVMKVWKKSELISMRYEGKCWVYRVSIGLLPLIYDHLMKWNLCYEGFERNQSWWVMRGQRKTVRFSVHLWRIHSELLSFWIHYYFCLTGLVVCFWGGGAVVGVGRVFGSISCSCSTIYTLPINLTSLTSFKTMFNIVYELASFKTMFNIV